MQLHCTCDIPETEDDIFGDFAKDLLENASDSISPTVPFDPLNVTPTQIEVDSDSISEENFDMSKAVENAVAAGVHMPK